MDLLEVASLEGLVASAVLEVLKEVNVDQEIRRDKNDFFYLPSPSKFRV